MEGMAYMYINKDSELFTAHNARQAAIKFNASVSYEVKTDSTGNILEDNYGNPIFTGKTFNPCVFVRMAKTLDSNIDMSKGIEKGTRVFDWENSIVMKLEESEIAVVSMLSNPYYLMKWNDVLVEDNGKERKNELFSAFHSSRGQNASSKIFRVACTPKGNNIQVAISMLHNKPGGTKDNIWIGLKIHQAHALGLAMGGFLSNMFQHKTKFRDFRNNDNSNKSYNKNTNTNTVPEKTTENTSFETVDISDIFG
jgi:hypothetical protein